MRKLLLALALTLGVSPAVAQNYTATQGVGTTFGSKLVSSVNYPQIVFCDPATPANCVAVNASGQITVAPGTATTTLTAWTSATGSGTTQSIMAVNAGSPSVLVQLVQTTTLTGGAVTFEGTYDSTGSNWVTISASQLLDPSAFTQIANPYTFVANAIKPFLIMTQGFQAIRIRLSTVITGTGSVTPYVTQLPYNPAISAILQPLSTGSNIIGKVGIDQTTPGITNAVTLGTDPCTYPIAKTNFAISQITSTQLFAGTSAKKTYICSLSIIAGAAETINLIEGTGSVCATGSAAIIGSTTAANGLSLAANGGLTLGSGAGSIAIAGNAAADNICLTQAGSSRISGNLTYVQN